MKKQLFALFLPLIACTAVHAEHAQYPWKQEARKKSKEAARHHEASTHSTCKKCRRYLLPHVSATDTEDFALSSTYQRVPFTGSVDVVGHAANAITSTEFLLSKGHYLISFSTSSTVTSQPDSTATFFDFAVSLNGSQYITFSDSSELGVDYSRLSAFTVEVIAPIDDTELSIEARIDSSLSANSSMNLNQRSISIIKLS